MQQYYGIILTVIKMNKKIIFMGTPIFAKEILSFIYENKICEVVAVVTQPDKALNRKKEPIFSPVKQYVIKNQIPYFQPNKIGEISEQLKEFNADAILTCAYGQFLPKSILNLFTMGVINIHASLLPKYRGGAPIQYAILNGEKETGISLMKSVLKMDAGPIYCQKSIEINQNDNLETLTNKLIYLAKNMINSDLNAILDNQIHAKAQDETLVSFAYNITKEQEKINFDLNGLNIANHINALYPSPCAYAYLNQKRVKFGCAKFILANHNLINGSIVEINEQFLKVSVKDGFLYISKIQLEGKKMSDVSQIYNGLRHIEGKIFQ